MFSSEEEKVRRDYNTGSTWPQNDEWHSYTHNFINTHVQTFLNKKGSEQSLILNAGSGDTRYNSLGTIFDCDIAEEKLVLSENPIHASITSIPCQNSFFDLYICVGSVLNYCDLAAAISEMSRVLKPGGDGILEFERSKSAEFLFTVNYGKNIFKKNYSYNGQIHSLWLYSESYVDSLLSAYGFCINEKVRFQIGSSLASRVLHNDLKAAKWSKYDKYLGIVSSFFAHNCIYYIKRKES